MPQSQKLTGSLGEVLDRQEQSLGDVLDTEERSLGDVLDTQSDRALEHLEEVVPFDAGVPLLTEQREDEFSLSPVSAFRNLFEYGKEKYPGVEADALHALFRRPGFGLTQAEREVMAEKMIRPGAGFLLDFEEKPFSALTSGIDYMQGTTFGKAQRSSLRFLFGGTLPQVGRALKEDTKPFNYSELVESLRAGWNFESNVKVSDLRKQAILTEDERSGLFSMLKKYPKLGTAVAVGELIEDFGWSIMTEIYLGKALLAAGKNVPIVRGILNVEAMSPGEFKRGFDNVVSTQVEQVMNNPEELTRLMEQVGLEDVIEQQKRTDALFKQLSNEVGVSVFDNFKVTTADEAIKAAVHHELLTNVMKITKPDGSPIVTKKQLDSIVEAISLGKAKTIDNLNQYELEAAYKDIQALLAAPKNWRPNFFGRRVGGVPSWKVFETMGIPRIYEVGDNAIYRMNVMRFDRGDWAKEAIRTYEKRFGRKFDDAANEVAARMADVGPQSFIIYQAPDWSKRMSTDEINYLADMVRYDRENYWDPLADLAEELGYINKDVPRQVWYFHHRTKFIDSMKGRLQGQIDRGERVVMPSDYRLERILREKIPTDITIPEFFARVKEDDILHDWRNVTGASFNEELRKLYLEPASKEMEALAVATGKGEIRQFTADWINNIRRRPTKIDEAMNEFVEFATRGKITKHERMYEKALREFRKDITLGTMGLNSRPVMKNLFQSLLTINTIGSRATMAGMESVYSKGGRRLLGSYHSTLGRGTKMIPLSQIDISTARGWSALTSTALRGSLAPFHAVDMYINVAGAGNGALYKLITSKPNRMRELVEFAATQKISAKAAKTSKFWNVLADAVDAGKFGDLVDLANRNIKMTQWSYLPHDMPRHLWGQTGKTVWMYTSWPSNYFTVHLPQLTKQMFTGTGVFGEKVPAATRVALASFVARTAAIIYTGKKLGYDMSHLGLTGPLPQGKLGGFMPIPLPVTPGVELAYGLGMAVHAAATLPQGAKNFDRAWKAAYSSLKNTAPTLIPFGTAGRRGYRIFGSGEEDISSAFFRPIKKKTGGLKTLDSLNSLKPANILKTGAKLP